MENQEISAGFFRGILLKVMDEEEFEIAQVKLNKRVNNFEKLYSLKIALERGLINEEEYTQRKALLE
ncbi:hypothetical protein [Sphaerospermopsis sp. LEGE 00249]|uniref:hypothetical protein n=1 Tax=Sphaerospermopsis sp. LEGE 00249 TaxID=1380707 RepID=UPI001C9B415E|nr:hypothetical protein [Sphaerospermopsis sp. LEGE 00249]